MYKYWFNLLVFTTVITCSQDANSNHKVYNNYYATALHDSYLRFGNESTFTLPLKKKWSHTNIQCLPQFNAVFLNNTYYCITWPNLDIAAVNPLNGKLKWTTDFGVTDILGVGLTATSNGQYLASWPFGAYYPENITITDVVNGELLQSIPVPEWAELYITAGEDTFYGFLCFVPELFYGPTVIQLFTINPAKKINSVNLVINMTLNITEGVITNPTLCSNGQIMVISDRVNFLSAYNTSTWDKIWENNVTAIDTSHSSLMCLESNSEANDDRILFADSIYNALTGKKLNNKPFNWGVPGHSEAYLTPMFNVAKQILIGNDLIAYDLDGINEPTEVLWNITIYDGPNFIPLEKGIIVDDFIFFVNDTRGPDNEFPWQGQIIMIDINDGEIVWRSEIVDDDDRSGFSVTPGIDENGNALLITTYDYGGNNSGIVFMDAYQ